MQRTMNFICRSVIAASMLLLSFCLMPVASAAGVISEISAGTQYVLPSKVLQEDRAVLVSLPADYDFSANRYPVLYVLDGEKSFRSISSLAQFLGETGRIPKMIVIGVVNTDRSRDFAPPRLHPDQRRQLLPTPEGEIAGAERFAGFLKTELIPWVDQRYRTVDWRALHGHSLGGLMNFYMLVHEPGLFQAHLAASASLWWDQRAYVEKAQKALAQADRKTWLFFATGDQEDEITKASQDVAKWLEEHASKKLTWRYQYYPHDTHGTTPHRTALDGLEFIFSEWPLSSTGKTREQRVNQVLEHQQHLLEVYGFGSSLSALDVLAYGIHRLRAGEFEAAEKAVQQWETQYTKHPLGSFFYGSMAQLYAKKDKPQEALDAYRRAQQVQSQALGFDGGRYQQLEAELQEQMRPLLEQERKAGAGLN